MTDNVDQITKEPDVIKEPERIKDPKKVAAGKKLAEYHKKAKEALNAEKNNDSPPEESKSWVPEISPGTVIALVGISLTAFDLYMRWNVPATPTAVVQHTEKTIEPVKGKIGME